MLTYSESKRHPHFHPIVDLRPGAPVYDMSTGPGREAAHDGSSDWGIGRYNEKRPEVYTGAHFEGRDIHVGIDLFSPAGTAVYSFADGEIFLFTDNDRPGDYGPTLITRHLRGTGEIALPPNARDQTAKPMIELFVLYGHLSRTSLAGKRQGQKIHAGEKIAWVGDSSENGGWPPHVHFQLCVERPVVADMPGVVSEADRQAALLKYPDPRLVLGPIY